MASKRSWWSGRRRDRRGRSSSTPVSPGARSSADRSRATAASGRRLTAHPSRCRRSRNRGSSDRAQADLRRYLARSLRRNLRHDTQTLRRELDASGTGRLQSGPVNHAGQSCHPRAGSTTREIVRGDLAAGMPLRPTEFVAQPKRLFWSRTVRPLKHCARDETGASLSVASGSKTRDAGIHYRRASSEPVRTASANARRAASSPGK